MEVFVISTAGKTGRAVVEKAVAAGHQVTTFARQAGNYEGPGVHVFEGDATDRTEIDTAMFGQEAVIDTVGGKTPYKSTTLESSVAGAVIESMGRHGVRRLVVTSMIGKGDSEANTPIYDRLLLATFLLGADKDKAAMESSVEASGLDWVILRPAILSDDRRR